MVVTGRLLVRQMVLQRVLREGRRVTEAFVFGQGGARAETLAALAAVDLHAAVGVHALVSAQV